jgi:hypothetical protein
MPAMLLLAVVEEHRGHGPLLQGRPRPPPLRCCDGRPGNPLPGWGMLHTLPHCHPREG